MTKTHKTDLKFFTNLPGETLLDRFVKTIEHAKFFDVLVGYFRISGFNKLANSLGKTEQIRILVGLNTDRRSYELIQFSKGQQSLQLESVKKSRDIFAEALAKEIESDENESEVEKAANTFIELIKSGKLHFRVHPDKNIHAKIYITRFDEDFIDFGRVITGSSNFSESGFEAQREFNVELKDRVDVEYALERFEELWEQGIDISEEFIDTIKNKTWLKDNITPYEIYLKLLYEYFKEDINVDEEIDITTPDDFMKLEYQKQAVLSANKILDIYDGVFLSDVVGLGKTFITAMFLQQLPKGRKLVICPPVLADYWKETLNQFYVSGFEIESLGKLDKILEKGTDKYTYIIIDEAHRFRNEMTKSYDNLLRICEGKKVVLISATPYNNRLEDIKAQIKLFQPIKNSKIPGIPNLDNFFKNLQKELDNFDKGTPEYLDAVKRTSEKVRDKVLKHIMVRRTRSEIKKYFSDDLLKQGLRFPEVHEPQRIIYEFDSKTEQVFNDTIVLLRQFKYARYTPLLFLKKALSEFDLQQQRNIGGFMKGILVKRLESSFFAFKNSLDRFIQSYYRFTEMYDSGTIYISKKVDVFDLLDTDNEAKLIELVENEKAEKYSREDFKDDYRKELEHDLAILKEIHKLWKSIDHDPKSEQFIHELKSNKHLKNKRVIIFSESKETVDYLYSKIDKEFPNQVASYSSSGGKYNSQNYAGEALRDIIKANYQPKHHNPKDDINILITTDVLAEGINLHRSNILINYDLPWNPTRVLQRVGRVNRVGSEHDKVFVFNIFPTSQSDEHLGLEGNIKSKIQAFHNILGEDAKYLSDDEQLSTHELFGDNLFKKLSDKSFLEEDSEEETELKYLKVIRDLRDKNPDLFEKIKYLPKKARTAKEHKKFNQSLLTFFRKGRLKKFIQSHKGIAEELSFLEAVKLYEADEKTLAQKIPSDFFELLKLNKDFLDRITSEDNPEESSRGGNSNESKLIKLLKAKHVRTFKGFTEEETEYLKQVRSALEHGTISRFTVKTVKGELVDDAEPLKVLNVLRKYIKIKDINRKQDDSQILLQREIILSEYLVG